MSKELIFLGIESSCDETAASIVKEDKKPQDLYPKPIESFPNINIGAGW